MDNFELIQDFLDGTLNTTEEEEFFIKLSSNDEIRSEFKQQIAIKEAIKGDTKAFTPSPAATIGIFKTLGFTSPTMHYHIEGSTTKSTLFNKYLQSILTGVTSTVATAIIIFTFFMPKGNNIPSNNTNIHNSEKIEAAKPPVNNIGETNIVSTSKNISQNVTPRTIIKYIYLNKSESHEPKNDVAVSENISNFNNNNINLLENISVPETQIHSPSMTVNRPDFEDLYVNSLNKVDPAFNLYSPDKSKIGIGLELKGVENWYTQTPAISPAQTVKFNNIDLSFLYSISNNYIIGVNYRKENFYQDYMGRDSIGNLYRYEQQPNLTSFSLLFRYKPFQTGLLMPFVQLSPGFNTAGFVARGLVGTEFSLYEGFSFIIGIDYSILYYKHQNQNYSTQKFGLNYGLQFKL